MNENREGNGNTFSRQQKVDTVLEEIVEYFTKIEKRSLNMVHRGIKSQGALLEEVREYVKQRHIPQEEIPFILDQFRKYIWGYHVLEELINDDSISDIKVINENIIRIKRYGKRMTSHVKFKSKSDYKQFVDYVAIKNRTNLSDINAVQNFTDKNSNKKFILRFNIATEFVNSVDIPYLHIRKIAKNKLTLKRLTEMDMLTKEMAAYLMDKVIDSKGIIFTGKGASGKTTLVNALLDYIPSDNSGLVIQENEELFTDIHPDLMFQHVVTSRGEGKIQYTLKDLARNGLLTDLDYFIIGEIKGGEALYFLNASYTGHKCMATIHGNSSTEAMDKLADYIKYESDYAKAEILKMLSNLSVVVYMENFKVKEVSEITGFDAIMGNIVYHRVLG